MDEIKKEYYSIGEVADMMCCSATVIRNYEKIFSLILKKSKSGVRSFDANAIEKLKYIRYLVVTEGYTLKGAVSKFHQKYPNRYLLMNEAKKPVRRIRNNPFL